MFRNEAMDEELYIETLDPREDVQGAAKVKRLLYANGLKIEDDIECFVVARSLRQIVACAGLAGCLVKCVAIAPEHRGTSLALRLMNEIQQLALDRGQAHLFLYTKPDRVAFFEGCGFHKVVEVSGHACLMENTPVGIKDYCDSLRALRQPGQRIGSVVLNANPFTLGHLHLVRTALEQCDWLHVFVVSEDASTVCYADRLDLVRAGLDGMDRVTVHGGSEYLVSKATFPSYFIKDTCVVKACSTAIDLLLFRKHIAPALGITHRFVGNEPYCRLTRKYNQDMSEWLEKSGEEGNPIHVVEIPRFEVKGRAVSASDVRRLLAGGDFETVASLVPATTLARMRARYGLRAKPQAGRRLTEIFEVG
jgi:[citrate (pro-3S)-lyase] ligase